MERKIKTFCVLFRSVFSHKNDQNLEIVSYFPPLFPHFSYFYTDSAPPPGYASCPMVLILDGNSEHVGHARRTVCLFGDKNSIRDCSRSNQMPETDQITDIAPYARICY